MRGLRIAGAPLLLSLRIAWHDTPCQARVARTNYFPASMYHLVSPHFSCVKSTGYVSDTCWYILAGTRIVVSRSWRPRAVRDTSWYRQTVSCDTSRMASGRHLIQMIQMIHGKSIPKNFLGFWIRVSRVATEKIPTSIYLLILVSLCINIINTPSARMQTPFFSDTSPCITMYHDVSFHTNLLWNDTSWYIYWHF